MFSGNHNECELRNERMDKRVVFLGGYGGHFLTYLLAKNGSVKHIN